MKKFLTFLMAFALLLGAISCTSCNKEKQKMENVVETVIESDLNYMANNYGDYVFYEASIVLDNYVDDENCDASIESVTDIFQVGFENPADTPKVVMISHSGELMYVKTVEGYWCEDVVISVNDLKLSFNDAFNRLMSADCVKPHSKYCVLRKPLGPRICNAQYIFGNAGSQLVFVDALTGDVSLDNPAFNPIE